MTTHHGVSCVGVTAALTNLSSKECEAEHHPLDLGVKASPGREGPVEEVKFGVEVVGVKPEAADGMPLE